jgi:hypothetical protein
VSATRTSLENDPWKVSEREHYGRPIAAPLEDCARLLGDPEAEVRRVAASIEPYQHAEGYPVWSLYLVERALHPERFRPARSGAAPTRVRAKTKRQSAA